MPTSLNLTSVALVMSMVSACLSIVALWPVLKDRLSVVRDAILWMAVIAVAGTMLMMLLNESPEKAWTRREPEREVPRPSLDPAASPPWNATVTSAK